MLSGVRWYAGATLCLVLLGTAGFLGWHVQGWRCERHLTALVADHAGQRATWAAAQTQAVERVQQAHEALQRRLQASEAMYYKELSDAQQTQTRLRDRLATADVRLSALVEADARGCPVPATAGTGELDHGTLRARLDHAHAQRIIAITAEGDRGLIALRACQAYVRALQP